MSDFANNLITLVADRNTLFLMQGLYKRHQSFSIKDISGSISEIFAHPQNDPGVYHQCVEFLRPFINTHNYALVLFDHEGSGQETKSRNYLENEIEEKLSVSGWGNRAKVIVLEPEIEAWIWSDSPHVEKILGWEHSNPNLRAWLKSEQFIQGNEIKPKRPKEAVEAALEEVREPRSSSRYQQIAEKVSFKNCTDESFLKLKNTLQEWFSL